MAAAFLIGHRMFGDGAVSAREETLDGVLGLEPVADLRVLPAVQRRLRVVFQNPHHKLLGMAATIKHSEAVAQHLGLSRITVAGQWVATRMSASPLNSSPRAGVGRPVSGRSSERGGDQGPRVVNPSKSAWRAAPSPP